jgi:aminopeptidase YwaD
MPSSPAFKKGILTMNNITEHLSNSIGTRPAGSDNEHKAAGYIAETMKSLGLEVEIQPFSFLGWQPQRPATVELRAPEKRTLPAGSFLFSGSTPEGGVEGRLEPVGTMYLCRDIFEWPKYAVKAEDGSDLGYLVAHTGGRAINFVLYELGRLFGRAPYAVVDMPSHEYFQEQLAKGNELRVWMDTAGTVTDGLTTQNVIGTLAGASLEDEEVVVCAHYDTTLDSPGACDNASGVDAMLRIAETLSKEPKPAKTIRFIAFGAEEYILFGSKYYVSTLKEKGGLDRIKNVVNLDMVGFGDHLKITVAPETCKRRIQEVFSGLTDTIRFEYDANVLPISDHFPFYEEGIPVVMFLGWPYDDYHQSTDGYDKIDPDMIQKTAAAATAVTRHFAG